jgi:dihydroorotate dehydrogenase electron transfer subunit
MRVSVLQIDKIENVDDLIILQFKYNRDDIYPGQFFMIGPLSFENKDFILNRPFSVSDYGNGLLKFRIRISGKFTKWLLNCNEGDKLRLIGPLGNFIEKKFFEKYREIILIGGGIGTAPLIFFANYFRKNNFSYKFSVGFKSKNELYYLRDIKDKNIIIYTEDGSKGEKGFCTEILNTINRDEVLIISCGPKGMYYELKQYKEKFHIKVLLEERMACGFGVCLGCVVKTFSGYKRVCVEGPIFDLNEIDLEKI